MQYDAHATEQKWRTQWQKQPIGQTKPTGSGKKFYCLDMFPYPSGSGLHVGHWKGYVLSDVYTRIKWLEGYNILHPMGWDAFGLPAENDAIKKGIHPAIGTARNIENFKKQLAYIGAIYDWSKEINTTDPEYYKWTQWIFVKMYKAGLAYEAFLPINWCPSCLTGLANEEVVNDRCERCGTLVEIKNIRQWALRITTYAEKLLDGLNKLNWPEKVKAMQRNWIGKSEGLTIDFKLQCDGPQFGCTDAHKKLTVYTTRPDTIYGISFIAAALGHELIESCLPQNKQEEYCRFKSIQEKQTATEKEKSKEGFFTGLYAIHSLTNERIPIYITPYVLREYATGTVMGVPAHDERDYAFAQIHDLPVKHVIQNPAGDSTGVYEGDGLLMQSGIFDGLKSEPEGKKLISDHLIKLGLAQRAVRYKLRDWIFSRQRYWGEPIPLIHCEKCGVVPVPEDQLPVILPDVESYQPTGTGESPLASIESWVNTTCPVCGGKAKRETNTMPQWAGSSWYFLRYPNPHLADAPFSEKDMKYWLPVDLYVGGIEHAILHLLYARFYTKVLHDLGYVPFDEPFTHLFNQGMVCKYSEKTHTVEKMSKSKGNVVNPDDIVQKYGTDVLRLYILFMGPPELDCEWQDNGLEGMKRFLIKLHTYLTTERTILSTNEQQSPEVNARFHQFVKAYTERLIGYKPNTAISAAMEWLNEMNATQARISKANVESLLVLLSVMVPHLSAELLENLCNKKLENCAWPTYDPDLARKKELTIVIQVNGKTRGNITVPDGTAEKTIIEQALIAAECFLKDKMIEKTIVVSGKLINFVVK
ncbi:MAG: leucine-tRNA ligase [candidate division TM6 bacterium GW2011_GWE2_41_16]|nr:MAG: leucine-tRNA ligase [candidate division TM6 bacterium GW2011_GWE2_41_16]